MNKARLQELADAEAMFGIGVGYLTLHVIYQQPSDFPKHWVVRQHRVNGGWFSVSVLGIVCGSLEEARREIPPGAICLGRQEGDAPVIYEVWI